MTPARSGAGDPARSLSLLWRAELPGGGSGRGPQQGLTVDAVVVAAIGLADADGMDAVTMRRVATALGSAPMTLYTYVPGREELVELMLDQVYREMVASDADGSSTGGGVEDGADRSTADGDSARQAGWRGRVRGVIDANRDLHQRHPWLSMVDTTRPTLGPGAIAKYERELSAFDGHGLDDVTMDAALAWTLAFVRDWARTAAAAAGVREATALTEQEWWDRAGPLLGQVLDVDRYPLAIRVGGAAGQAQGAAWDALRAFDFGVGRVLDGLAPLFES